MNSVKRTQYEQEQVSWGVLKAGQTCKELLQRSGEVAACALQHRAGSTYVVLSNVLATAVGASLPHLPTEQHEALSLCARTAGGRMQLQVPPAAPAVCARPGSILGQ